MSESQPSWIGRQIGGRYQITKLLGRGGMSSVYQANDPNLQRTVAVKIIHPHLSEQREFVRRFEQEASAVAQLRHPNIIQVHDFDHQGEVYYMILEHVPGETLEARLDALKSTHQRHPLGQTLDIMMKLCNAVSYAHQRGMIHRDLKPSNVIITPTGEPILMDFGIAKIVGGNHVHTATGATIGTAAYMAPEQVRGEEIDQRADLYSLGIILFEMLSGRPPFEGKSALTVMMKHIEEPLPDIRILNMDVPDMLVGILEKALAKNPNDRFGSATEMGNAMRALTQPSASQLHLKPPPLTQTAVPNPTATLSETPAPAALQNKPTADKSTPRWPLLVGAVLLLALIVGAVLLYPRLFPTTPSSENMVMIPTGTYSVGLGDGSSQVAPAQDVALDTFWIDRYEVTNAEYTSFVAQRNHEPPVSWIGEEPPAGREMHPVQGVSWSSADAYCRWVGKRLPTEAEWEVAARGTSGLLYPWGDERTLVSLLGGGTYPVGSVAANRSVFNVYDMAGNVWEWVDTPYTAVPTNQRVLRGGSFDNQRDLTYRLMGDPTLPTMQASAGFRCAASEVEVVPEDGILVQDEFSDPGSGWESWDDGSVLYGYHPPDFYHVQAGSADTLTTAYFGGSFDDVTMEALVFVDATDTETGNFRYGLTLRRSGDSFYAFTIAPRAGEWAVLKKEGDALTVLDEGSVDALQGLAGKDTLRVDASGADFAFSVNGRLVSQLSDASLSRGDIGFMVQTFDETRAHVHFDRLSVRDVVYRPTTAVLFSDDFTNPESGWPSVSQGSVLSGYHPPDYYHLQSGEPNHRSLAFFDGTMANFTMESDIFVDSTDTADGDFYYGLVARRQVDDYYAFMLSPQTGAWRVSKNSAAGEEILAEGSDTALRDTTATNRLRVDAEGDNLIFHVNGRPLIRVTDSSYSEGDIGFVVETVDQTRAHIHYDTVTLRQVDADLEAAPTAAAVVAGPTEAPTVEPTNEPAPAPTAEIAATAVSDDVPSGAAMVLVDGGTYQIADDTAVALNPFWIDQTEVRSADFAAYLDETGESSDALIDEDDHPVHGVTWNEADAYCNWANKRLPSEAEWVAAARGASGWLYPWGNERNIVPLPNSGTYPVGSIPANRSVFGAFDMAGNVWEWVGETALPTNPGERVLRGGANGFQQDLTQRLPGDPDSSVMTADAGFRCAADEVIASDATGSLLLYDDFASVESGWWQAREPVNNYFYGYHPSDFYHVQVSTANECLAVNNEFSATDFMAEVQVFTASTDTADGDYRYGMTFREGNDGFYALTIAPRSQRWQIFKSTSRGLELLDEGTNGAIRGDTQARRDRLFVIANGPKLTFFVNGELVSELVDDTYADGRFGFIVNTLDETYTHAHFDAIAVQALPEAVEAPSGDAGTAEPLDTEPLCRGTVSAEHTMLDFITHTVAEGDTVSSISRQYGISEEALVGANGRSIVDPSFIRVGQTVIIPQG